jgi:hypothetical protein
MVTHRIRRNEVHLRSFPFVIQGFRSPQLDFELGVYIRMSKNLRQSLFILAVGGLLAVGSAAAQTQNSNTSGAGAGVDDAGHPRVNQVNQREQNQQDRIANGVKNDKLTPGQTSNLERGEQRLQNNEKKDMAADNGHLTKKDQRQLNREANHMSNKIYKDKHDGK